MRHLVPWIWFILVSSVLFSQTGTGQERSILDNLGDDGMIFLRDGGSYFTAPLEFSGNDWLLSAGVAGGTILLMTTDETVRDRVGRKTESSINDDFWDIPTSYGVVAYANIVSLSVYAGGLLARADGIRKTGRMLFQSISYSGISVMALRYIFGRNRPYGDNTPWQFNWFEWDNSIQSFPSGHTTVAFALSTVLAEEIGGIWARVGFYGLAALTGYSRILNNQHWLSDVVAGAGLGILTGLHVVNEERKREAGHPGSGVEFGMTPSGVRLTFWLQ